MDEMGARFAEKICEHDKVETTRKLQMEAPATVKIARQRQDLAAGGLTRVVVFFGLK